MEFVKPNKNRRSQPQRPTPRAGGARLVNPRPVQPSIQVDTPSTSHMAPISDLQSKNKKRRFSWPLSKAEAMSYVREFRFTKKGLVVGVISLMIVSSLIVGVVAHQRDVAKKSAAKNISTGSVHDIEYQTILPDGKSITELGGWKRVSPTESEPVFAYTDKIGKISINVSQQPLPKSFIGDTDNQVEELAKKFNATSKIEAGNIKIYVGSSIKGPQSAIFTKNSLLILIKSQEKIDDASWAEYVQSLN